MDPKVNVSLNSFSVGIDETVTKVSLLTNISTLPSSQGLLADDVMPFIFTINLSIICSTVSLFGIVTNIINITVFVRQGFKETINISLLGLAISDLCSLVSLLWLGICYNPFFRYSDLPILTVDLQHFTGGWTHVIFTRITIFITAFITLERCICIVFPLKVKTIFTTKRVKMIIIGIYVFLICSMIPNYFIFRFGWKFVPERNRTMIGILYLKNRVIVENIGYHFQLIYPMLAFVLVVICSAILISKFNERMHWRHGTTSGTSKSNADDRDRQVVRMVLSVAIVFIISFTPSTVLFISMLVLPGMNMGKVNQNMFILSYSISFMSEAVNSSVNIFVYYKSSSNYRKEFLSLFNKDPARRKTKPITPRL